MKTTDEMLDEIENANNGDGPDPVATVDDPALAKLWSRRCAFVPPSVRSMRLRRMHVTPVCHSK